jgi:hypothetical protein
MADFQFDAPARLGRGGSVVIVLASHMGMISGQQMIITPIEWKNSGGWDSLLRMA